MKHLRLHLLAVILMAALSADAQKFHLSSPPVNGWFYMDTTGCANKDVPTCLSAKCVDVICENNIILTSGDGEVLYCEPHANKTYEIAIKYDQSIIVYSNIIKRKVQRKQKVRANTEIGEVPQNPKDKNYHLGLQVAQAKAPTRYLWYGPLLAYFKASSLVY